MGEWKRQPIYRATGVVPADGTLALAFRVAGSARVRATQVAVEMDSPGAATGWIRLNGAAITPFLPRGDAPAGEPFVEMDPGDELTAEWTNATEGATGKITVIWDREVTRA